MTHTIYNGSSSACFLLDGDTPYYAKSAYTVFVNGVTPTCFPCSA